MQKWLLRSPKVKSRVALYRKLDVTSNTICVENFTLLSKTAQGWYYAALLYELLAVTNQRIGYQLRR